MAKVKAASIEVYTHGKEPLRKALATIDSEWIRDGAFCDQTVADLAGACRRLQKRLDESLVLLRRCYDAGHKEGWQDGETSNEVFSDVRSFLDWIGDSNG